MRQIGWYKQQVRKWVLIVGYAFAGTLVLSWIVKINHGMVINGWEFIYVAMCHAVAIIDKARQ